MRINKATPAKKAKSTSVKKASPIAAVFGARAIVVVLVCFMGAAMIIGARELSQPAHVPGLEANPESGTAAQTAAKKLSASKLSDADGAAAALANSAMLEGSPAAESAKAAAPAAAPVTVTGCLELTDQTFRLKNTSGAEAPKARSWKSGFLKKGSASIAVVDAPKKLKLPDHVGERVSLTGVLVDREMQVRSLHRVAASCN
jgi:hypothetical protein